MLRTPSSVGAIVVAVLAVGCSSQSTPTAPSRALTIPGDNVSITQDRTASGLAAARPLVIQQVCDPLNPQEPPEITGVGATPNSLWPPNHKWNAITVNYTATDPCEPSEPVSCVLTVSSNEPVNDIGDGNTAPDSEVLGPHSVRLRAERAGPRNGRIYTIAITCTDQDGPVRTVTTTVTVAHDRRKA